MSIWLDLNESILPCSALRSAYFVLMTAAHFSDNQILLWNILSALISQYMAQKNAEHGKELISFVLLLLYIVHIVRAEMATEHM